MEIYPDMGISSDMEIYPDVGISSDMGISLDMGILTIRGYLQIWRSVEFSLLLRGFDFMKGLSQKYGYKWNTPFARNLCRRL